MGFLDRMIRGVANEIANGVANSVGNAVANKTAEVVNPYVDRAAENVKNNVVAKVQAASAQVEAELYKEDQQIVENKDKKQQIVVASKTQINFNSVDENGASKSEPLKFASILVFDSERSFVGDESMARTLRSYTLNSVQKAINSITSSNIRLASKDLPGYARIIIDKVIEDITPEFSRFGITDPKLIVMDCVPLSVVSSEVSSEAPVAAPSSWTCQYCGATNTGKFCSSCGAQKP